uniref:Uncharacterized protein n=1 Tax=Lygus hesperus TaxID=30085 RepID=A0A0A9XJL1_LYGHE
MNRRSSEVDVRVVHPILRWEDGGVNRLDGGDVGGVKNLSRQTEKSHHTRSAVVPHDVLATYTSITAIDDGHTTIREDDVAQPIDCGFDETQLTGFLQLLRTQLGVQYAHQPFASTDVRRALEVVEKWGRVVSNLGPLTTQQLDFVDLGAADFTGAVDHLITTLVLHLLLGPQVPSPTTYQVVLHVTVPKCEEVFQLTTSLAHLWLVSLLVTENNIECVETADATLKTRSVGLCAVLLPLDVSDDAAALLQQPLTAQT